MVTGTPGPQPCGPSGGGGTARYASGKAAETLPLRSHLMAAGGEGTLERLRLLGRGAWGSVYHVRDLKDGRDFALKVSGQASAVQRESARCETQLLKEFRHPAIVGYFADWEDEHEHFLLLELCHGNLRELLGEPRDFDEEYILSLFAQLCCGVAYLHSCGVVHGDLKTSNVCVLTLSFDSLGK